MQSNEVNILGKMNNDDFDYIRKSIIEMILETDMKKHLEFLRQFSA